ncbi:hypothetical protein [Paraflavitalea sp. CAU 1676]|uniref:hypothetical protein n=1 Tax=Paraflavitalea sp. CAU 1676 TaxID=3032598 RepID=UPI0023DC7D0B|nr:hypothetical protein [Paraflavitalea sp. CAU 1676]MDF2188078.1 hypothetical protein [Paraflavitalea sp. CAU 1676]
MISIKKILPLAAFGLILMSSCSKSNYQDGGTLDPAFKGSSFDYLVSRPELFDSLTKVIRLAGMEQILRQEEVTFFAPPSQSIMKSVTVLNDDLKRVGADTVYNLRQIKPAVWKKFLNRYLFKHKKSLTDYPQVDFENIPVYPGQPYVSYGNDVMNIGVSYNDASGIQYAGPRFLYLSYIQSLSSPTTSWLSTPVATSNILTTNGYVHVLRYASPITITGVDIINLTEHHFGFNPFQFELEALNAGIDR